MPLIWAVVSALIMSTTRVKRTEIAPFTGGVAQCGQEMRFAGSGRPDEHGTAMLRDELAVEQAQDFLFGDPFGEGEVVFFQRLAFGETWPAAMRRCRARSRRAVTSAAISVASTSSMELFLRAASSSTSR